MYYANVESIIKDYCMTIRHTPPTHTYTHLHTHKTRINMKRNG